MTTPFEDEEGKDSSINGNLNTGKERRFSDVIITLLVNYPNLVLITVLYCKVSMFKTF